MDLPRPLFWGVFFALLSAWLGLEQLQASVGRTSMLVVAILDDGNHSLAGALCTWPLVRRWGWGPFAVAAVVSVAIDLDHIVAAGTFDIDAWGHLPGGRPGMHSLAGILLWSGASWCVFRRPVAGYAVLVGTLLHVLRDAPTGVPLLWPWTASWILPRLLFWAVLGGGIGLHLVRMQPLARARRVGSTPGSLPTRP